MGANLHKPKVVEISPIREKVVIEGPNLRCFTYEAERLDKDFYFYFLKFNHDSAHNLRDLCFIGCCITDEFFFDEFICRQDLLEYLRLDGCVEIKMINIKSRRLKHLILYDTGYQPENLQLRPLDQSLPLENLCLIYSLEYEGSTTEIALLSLTSSPG